MNKPFIITGTDTDVGKTICAAMLTLALDGVYWKPLQSGTQGGTDTDMIKSLCGDRVLPERYVFTQPLSPHRAAELDGIEIDVDLLFPSPASVTLRHPLPAGGREGPTQWEGEEGKVLIIEGAGGLMVPVTRDLLYIDLFKHWNLPVILCARTGLGTINHTLLSIEALQARGIPLHGIVFIGDENADNIRTIADFSNQKVLGRIPVLEEVTANALQTTFERNFNKEDFI